MIGVISSLIFEWFGLSAYASRIALSIRRHAGFTVLAADVLYLNLMKPASYSSRSLPAPKRSLVILPAPASAPGASGKFESMKPSTKEKSHRSLVDLGREQGYLITFDQVNDFLPQDVASPTDLRAALDSFEDLDIKVLEVPTARAEAAAEEEAEEAEPEISGTRSRGRIGRRIIRPRSASTHSRTGNFQPLARARS